MIQQVEFPDCSFWQGVINWDKMGNAVIIRGGQNVWVDTKFEVNRAEAHKRGMAWGIYWFYDDRVSPSAQADTLARLFESGQPQPTMEIFCDWESTFNGKYSGVKNVVAFMQRVEQLLPWAKIGIYTGYYFFMANTNAVLNISQLNYLKTKPLWLAWYSSSFASVKIPRPWTSVTHWQYGTPARGAEFGVSSIEIDMNWYNGTQEEFTQRYGGVVITPPTEAQLMAWKGTTLDSIPVRTAIDGGAISPYLAKGTPISGDAVDGTWLHMTAPRIGWVNAGMNQTKVSWQTVTVTPPPPPPPPSTVLTPFTLTVDGHKPFSGNLEKL